MEKVILVGLGGFIGSIARYGISGGVHRLAPLGQFPFGTLVVNVLGCLLIGFIAGVAEVRGVVSPEFRLFLLVGVLGGFTTFSSFAYETMALAQGGDAVRAIGNVVLQPVGCLAAVWAGDGLVRAMWGFS